MPDSNNGDDAMIDFLKSELRNILEELVHLIDKLNECRIEEQSNNLCLLVAPDSIMSM